MEYNPELNDFDYLFPLRFDWTNRGHKYAVSTEQLYVRDQKSASKSRPHRRLHNFGNVSVVGALGASILKKKKKNIRTQNRPPRRSADVIKTVGRRSSAVPRPLGRFLRDISFHTAVTCRAFRIELIQHSRYLYRVKAFTALDRFPTSAARFGPPN